MTAKTPADLIRDEADLLAAGIQLQQQGLDLLLAEMRALAAMIPGETRIRRPTAKSRKASTTCRYKAHPSPRSCVFAPFVSNLVVVWLGEAECRRMG